MADPCRVRRAEDTIRLLVVMVEGGCVAVALGLVVAFAVGRLVFHLGLDPVLTGSMRPTFAPGDALLTRPVDVHSLRPGDIAVFVPPGEDAAYAHRITGVSDINGHVVVTTKGDANPAPDAWHAGFTQHRVPKVVTVVPSIGRPLTWLTRASVRAVAIAVLGLIFTAIGTNAIVRPTRRREALT